ncbi:MAG: sulfatase [Fulvivirga sp.]
MGQSLEKPNIIFLLVDDLGYADLRCYGSTFYETPHIDRLASQGMKFTKTYTAGSVCSPTRASIMSGKYPVLTGVTDWIPGKKVKDTKLVQPETKRCLAPEEITFAEILGKNGYDTFYAGKWHLANKKVEGSDPIAQGFSEYYGAEEMHKAKNPVTTDSLTAHTNDFIARKVKEGKPFFALLSYYDVHTPIQDYPDFIQHYKDKAVTLSTEMSKPVSEHQGLTRSRQDDPQYASMIGAVDKSVKSITKLIVELGIENNTIIIFTSDNGGLSTKKGAGPTSNSPLRAGKGWLYEGGIRVPLIVKFPGVIKAGTVCDEPTMRTVFYPTILQLAGLQLRPELHKDGISLVPLLTQKETLNRTDLYWHYPHYHGSMWTPGSAIRSDEWKLIMFYESDTYELYNLDEDMREEHDQAKKRPEIAKRLKNKLEKWLEETSAAMPGSNSDYDTHLK